MYYPNSYFLVGGRGHWSYATNTELIGARKSINSSVSSSVLSSSSSSSVGGADSKPAVYNLRVTKKIKKNHNKYSYNKSSSSKTTRKHKITRKGNNHKHNKRNKKTIKRL